MDIHTISEESYKNGYNAGVREFAERLKEAPSVINCEYEWLHIDIDTVANELIVNYESSKNERK